MLEKEHTILKNLNKKVEALWGTVDSIDKKIDGLNGEFRDKFDHLKKGVDGRMLLIITKLDLVEKKVNERMDRFEESNRKTGLLLEKLDSKFDFALEGYSSLKALIEGMNDRMTALEGLA